MIGLYAGSLAQGVFGFHGRLEDDRRGLEDGGARVDHAEQEGVNVLLQVRYLLVSILQQANETLKEEEKKNHSVKMGRIRF